MARAVGARAGAALCHHGTQTAGRSCPQQHVSATTHSVYTTAKSYHPLAHSASGLLELTWRMNQKLCRPMPLLAAAGG